MARFTWPTWGPPGSCRPHVDPMNLAIRDSFRSPWYTPPGCDSSPACNSHHFGIWVMIIANRNVHMLQMQRFLWLELHKRAFKVNVWFINIMRIWSVISRTIVCCTETWCDVYIMLYPTIFHSDVILLPVDSSVKEPSLLFANIRFSTNS